MVDIDDYENKYSVSIVVCTYRSDWDKLENTNTPILTLITCVEDMPNLRRCLQAEFIGVANERMDILVLN